MPAQKVSPRAVRMAQYSSSSSSSRRQARYRPTSMAGVKAFLASGRLRVTISTLPSRSTMQFLVLMGSSTMVTSPFLQNPSRRSAPTVARRTPFLPGPRALPGILRSHDLPRQGFLQGEGLGQAQVDALLDAAPDGGHGQGALGGDLRRQLLRPEIGRAHV